MLFPLRFSGEGDLSKFSRQQVMDIWTFLIFSKSFCGCRHGAVLLACQHSMYRSHQCQRIELSTQQMIRWVLCSCSCVHSNQALPSNDGLLDKTFFAKKMKHICMWSEEALKFRLLACPVPSDRNVIKEVNALQFNLFQTPGPIWNEVGVVPLHCLLQRIIVKDEASTRARTHTHTHSHTCWCFTLEPSEYANPRVLFSRGLLEYCWTLGKCSPGGS